MTPYRAPVRHRKSRYNDRQGIFDYILTVLKYVILAVAVLFVISFSQKAYSTGYRIFAESAVDPRGNAKMVTVTVKEGMSTAQIGRLLEKEGVIRDGDVFPYQERLSSYHGKIRPGSYTLSTDMTPQEIIKEMAKSAESGGKDAGAGKK
ncbi:MAG: endolytic transglycosylase MltG [Firmicutes bacterium]|nr:endolytic transglycosylase MltG [Bacillota bacterium]